MSCVLTLAMDDTSQQRFERERQRWFPPERNQIPAHLTLFHTLPENVAAVDALRTIAEAQKMFPMDVAEVRSLGRGVAYFLTSSDAATLHARLRAAFAEHLTAQDRQGFRPHVVVQNKASADAAARALAEIRAAFKPWPVQAVGLDLWRYLGGPWQHLRRLSFSQ